MTKELRRALDALEHVPVGSPAGRERLASEYERGRRDGLEEAAVLIENTVGELGLRFGLMKAIRALKEAMP